MAEEVDIIQHLLEVEREAADMMLDAQKKADEKIADARAQAEKRFKAQYDTIVAAVEKDEQTSRDAIGARHKAAFEEYSTSLESNQKDTEAFNALLDRLLYA